MRHQLPLNPQYGTGTYRRKIRLESSPGCVRAELEDDYHAFRLTMEHRAGLIARVGAQSLRVPSVTCTEAPDMLARFAGQSLDLRRGEFRGVENPRSHCTHLHDLLWLACVHARRPAGVRGYDITMPDLRDGRTIAEVCIDGVAIHRWTTDLKDILAPEIHVGRPLYKGFVRWSEAEFSGDALDAAILLQRGIAVGSARRVDVAAVRAAGLNLDPAMEGACYTHQRETRLRYMPMPGNIRDFSTQPDKLLRFL